jgi:hypothetical protein
VQAFPRAEPRRQRARPLRRACASSYFPDAVRPHADGAIGDDTSQGPEPGEMATKFEFTPMMMFRGRAGEAVRSNAQQHAMSDASATIP